MVVKIIMIAIAVGVVLLVIYDSIPGNEAYNTCVLQISTNYSRVLSYTNKRDWSQSQKCKATYEQILIDKKCIEDVRENYFTSRIVFWISQYRSRINNIIQRHNKYCYEYLVPVYEIDLTLLPIFLYQSRLELEMA